MKKNITIPNQDGWEAVVMDILLHAPDVAATCSRKKYEQDIEIRLRHALTAYPFHSNPKPICLTYNLVFYKLKTAIMAIYDIGACLATPLSTPEWQN